MILKTEVIIKKQLREFYVNSILCMSVWGLGLTEWQELISKSFRLRAEYCRDCELEPELGPLRAEDFADKEAISLEQIVGVLKQAEVGVPVAELIWKVGISEQTFYRWKKQYIGLESEQVREMKQLQDENSPEAAGSGFKLGQDDASGRDAKKR